jgi:hypothetical protein
MRRPIRSYSATPGGEHFEEEKGSGSAPVQMFSQEPLDQSDILGVHLPPCMTTDRVQQKNIFFACLAQGVEYRPGDGT